MNFGSEFALHDSDDEEEQVREDDPSAGPLSSIGAASAGLVNAAAVVPPHLAQLQQQQGLHQSQRGQHSPFLAPSQQQQQQQQQQQSQLGQSPFAVSSETNLSPLGNGAGGLGNGVLPLGALPLTPVPAPTRSPAAPPAVSSGAAAGMALGAGPRPGGAGGMTLGGGIMPSGAAIRALEAPTTVGRAAVPRKKKNRAVDFRVPSPMVGGDAAGVHGEEQRARTRTLAPPRAELRGLHPAAAEPAALPRPAPAPMAPQSTASRARTWTRKVDTNILNVDMAALGDAAPYATGDPTICRGCRACLSAVSLLVPATTAGTAGAAASPAGKGEGSTADNVEEAAGTTIEGTYDWTCEYCHQVNRIELDEMEKPVDGQESVDYILEAAPVAAAAIAEGKGGSDKDESAVLFVIDTSGSMCVTTAVEGRLALRGDRTKDMSRLLTGEDARNQLMPGQRKGMTYISRLQSMQAAIDAQLETMAKEVPSRHAGLITFNAEIALIGDGSADSRIVAGDRLSNDEALREVGRAYPLSRPVSEARSRLSDRLFALEEGGPTALGPAVVAGLSMLRERGGRGSRLVLCTDGLANVGLGALDNLQTDEEREVAQTFYEELGRESSENGVTIDVVSVDSDACDLENLGAMADVSGGTVTRVKASELTSNFAGILANPILASQVSVRVTLHKGLKFRNSDVGADVNTLDKDIGNVTSATELNFEYQVRGRAERRAMGINDNGIISSPSVRPQGPYQPTAAAADTPANAAATPAAAAIPTAAAATAAATPADAATPTGDPAAPSVTAAAAQASLPFQVQIRYTRLDGTKCLRVLTRTQRVTKSKAAAEKSLSMAVVAGHAASSSGMLASKGAYQSTRVSMRAWNNLMSRNQTPETRAQVAQYGSNMAALDSDVASAQRSEVEGGMDIQDMGGAVDAELEIATFSRGRKTARSTNDRLSLNAYKTKTCSKKAYYSEGKK